MIKGSISFRITSESDVVIARQRVAAFAEKIGVSKSSSVILSTIISQVSRFLSNLNNSGRINIYSVQRGTKIGFVISALSNNQKVSNVQTVDDKTKRPNPYLFPSDLKMDFDNLVSRNIIDEFNIVPVSNKGISIEIIKYL